MPDPDGFKVCQVFSELDDSGMPLLMMGLDCICAR